MKPDNATQPKTAEHATESGREVAEKSGRESQSAGKSKFSRDYWLAKVYKPTAPDPNGGRIELPEFWARVQHAGERRAVPLATPDRQTAARIAAKLYAAIRDKGWQAGLAEVLPGQAERKAAPCQSFGDHLAVAIAAKRADMESPIKAVTLRNYAQSARALVVLATGIDGGKLKFDYRGKGRAKWLARLDPVRADAIKAEDIQAQLAARIATAADESERLSAQRTLAKTVRQAKALFRGREWNPFASLKMGSPAPDPYTGKLDIPGLVRAAMEMESTDPQLLAALLMFAGAGLRRSEADNARWNWLDAEGGKITVQAVGNFKPKTRNSRLPIAVSAGYLAALLRLRPADAAADGFILAPELPERKPGTFYAYRAKDVFDRLQAWLRRQGVGTRTPIHDLRREFGSYCAEHGDIFVASRQLRHSGVAITEKFYAAQRRNIAPEFPAPLAI
jgi:integrase